MHKYSISYYWYFLLLLNFLAPLPIDQRRRGHASLVCSNVLLQFSFVILFLHWTVASWSDPSSASKKIRFNCAVYSMSPLDFSSDLLFSYILRLCVSSLTVCSPYSASCVPMCRRKNGSSCCSFNSPWQARWSCCWLTGCHPGQNSGDE